MAVSPYQPHMCCSCDPMAPSQEWPPTTQLPPSIVLPNLPPGTVPPVGGPPPAPAPAVVLPPNPPDPYGVPGGTGPNAIDSREKLEYLRPLLEDAARTAGVPFEVLAAVVLMESRGWSVNGLSLDLNGAGGIAQIGQNEVEAERQRHPGVIPEGPWYSPNVQIMAAALRLKDNQQPGFTFQGYSDIGDGWLHALVRYNGGETGAPHLNRAEYIDLFNEFYNVLMLDDGGVLPS